MGVMDLENMEIPDNKGGRPPKEETDDRGRQRREVDGDPYTMIHGKEYWEVKWDKWYNEHDNGVKKTVMFLSGETLCLPRTVVSNIHKYDIHDFNETLDEYPEAEDYLDDSVQDDIDDTPDGFLNDTNTTNSKYEPSQGLRSLIDE